MISAGLLDRRITLQRATITYDDYGGAIETWAPLATVWARLAPAKGREAYNAAQYVGKAVSTFEIRWSSTTRTLTVKDRLVFDGRVHDILDIRQLDRREGLAIDAEARSENPVAS